MILHLTEADVARLLQGLPDGSRGLTFLEDKVAVARSLANTTAHQLAECLVATGDRAGLAPAVDFLAEVIANEGRNPPPPLPAPAELAGMAAWVKAEAARKAEEARRAEEGRRAKAHAQWAEIEAVARDLAAAVTALVEPLVPKSGARFTVKIPQLGVTERDHEPTAGFSRVGVNVGYVTAANNHGHLVELCVNADRKVCRYTADTSSYAKPYPLGGVPEGVRWLATFLIDHVKG